jgi:hypothetical protein
MATKKISELPLITALSGSQQETLIPVVVGGLNGTTNRITAENFSKFVNAYNATTSSNTFIGAQIINGNLTVTGNQVISGRLTVNELVAQYETASIIFSSGSNKFGDEPTDVHEFTGSLDLIGNFILNGASLNNSFVRIHQATGSLQNFTASQDSRNFVISQYTASTDAHIVGISDFTSSQLIVNTGLASVTASLNNFSGSTNAFTGSIEKTTASIHLATASLNYFYQSTSSLNGFTASQADRNLNLSIVTGSLNRFTSSQDDRNFVISQFTSSTNAHIVGISDFTSSQLAVNLGNSIYTASVDSHIVGISTYTSSVRDTLARVHQTTQSLQVATASLQQFTASQDARNFVVSQVTGSLIGITNGLMAFTAALDNTYATDAQLYQLYQSTRSLELHSGSMIGVTNGLMAYTASNTSLNTGLRGEVDGIEAYTASLKAAISVSGTNVQIIGDLNVNKLNVQYVSSSVLVTSGSNTFGDQSTDKHEFTGSVAISGPLYVNDVASTLQIVGNGFGQSSLISPNGALVLTPGLYGVQINGTYPDLQANGNITANGSVTGNIIATNNVVSSSTQVQNYDVFALNSNLYTSTGSLIGITNGLMAFTAALDSTYATDAQLYQLYQATQSLELHSGSMIGITNALMAFTAALDSTYATDAQLYQLYAETASIKAEIAGIEAYTASLKGAAIVSSSQQIQNYFTFARTGSANTFYGNQTITGSLLISGSGGSPSSQVIQIIKDTLGNGTVVEESNMAITILSAPGQTKLAMGASNAGNYGYIQAMQDGTSWTNRSLTLQPRGGDVTISNGNLVIGTAGKGIDFSATANSAGTTSSELLNDYEEGTWSPTIRGSGTAGTYELATDYTTYTKIGRQVTLNGQIKFGTSVTGGGTGYLQILGAPFTKAENTVGVGSVRLININFTGDYVNMAFASLGATTTMFLSETVDNSTAIDLPISSAVANAEMQFTITYFV